MKGIDEFNLQEFTGAPTKTEGQLGEKALMCVLEISQTKSGLFRVVTGSSDSEQQMIKKSAEDNEGL